MMALLLETGSYNHTILCLSLSNKAHFNALYHSINALYHSITFFMDMEELGWGGGGWSKGTGLGGVGVTYASLKRKV